MAAQEETDSVAGSQRDDDDDDVIANGELPDAHVTNGTVYTERHDVEMMDIAGDDEQSLCDDDPLLELNRRGTEKTRAGKFSSLINGSEMVIVTVGS